MGGLLRGWGTSLCELGLVVVPHIPQTTPTHVRCAAVDDTVLFPSLFNASCTTWLVDTPIHPLTGWFVLKPYLRTVP